GWSCAPIRARAASRGQLTGRGAGRGRISAATGRSVARGIALSHGYRETTDGVLPDCGPDLLSRHPSDPGADTALGGRVSDSTSDLHRSDPALFARRRTVA